eukprot:TRINITY_DN20364_c0_g1_i1.p1 TRINITY_DN20364_c0_g1~~TRINITY_DN20364_c0_g1_i1.p1  ORF type:complete len:659 (+),score=50.67 TRINITY_DN20364_c0_g1_i1:248-1978(+)
MTDEAVLSKLEECTRDANRLQLETLQTIIERNGCARYLQPHFLGYDGPIDCESFKRLVPISSYEDYADHIGRLADGHDDDDDLPILSVDPLLCFFYSSGTSSLKPKLIPYFDSKHSKAASTLAHQASAANVRRLFPPRPSINKILWFLYAGNITETKGGVKVMAASAYPLQNNTNQSKSPLLSMCVSPPQVLFGSDTKQQMYCHLLCGLKNSDSIDGIRAPYAVGLIRAFRLLESEWEKLCDDIKYGSVSSEITEVTMRDSVEELLNGPQPNISKRIREICEGREWSGILGKLWPHLRYVSCVATGSMQQYHPMIKYYAGDVPIMGGDYFSSECSVAINMDRMKPPELTRFVMIPTAAYFEFLPFDLATGLVSKEALDFSGVEIGKAYEVVVTTYRGLFRYRLGDIVKIVGFYNSSPEVEYVSRAPKSPCEVFTERELMTAMENLQPMLRGEDAKAEVMEFTSFFDLESSPKHVVVFMEVSGGCMFLQGNLEESAVVLRRCAASVESSLGSIYNVQRTRGDLGPLEIAVVKSGSFDNLLQMAVENGAPANQYKPPRILRNQNIVDLMRKSIIVTAY